MMTIARQLKEHIDAVRPRLLSIPESHASEKPYPDKWSIKEILGHLIDSASNNHQRIVRLQEVGSMAPFSYTQEHWVKSQHYQTEAWFDLIEFWHRYNSHLAHIIGSIDLGSLDHVCDVGYPKPSTLRFIVEDYFRHVQHHIDQILSNSDPRNRRQWERRVQ